MVTDWVAAQKMRWYAAVEAGLPPHASAHHGARPSFPTGTPRWRRACLRRRSKAQQWALRGVCQAKAPTAARHRRRPGGQDGSSRWALSALCWRYARFKTPFFCCWFDSCLWLQVRGGRSEHLRCQHSHPPTGAAVGYGSERAYPMAGGEWHPAAPSINRTIYRCLLQGFENGLNLQSRESPDGRATHKARATSTRARLARLQDARNN